MWRRTARLFTSYRRFHGVANNKLDPSFRVRIVSMFQDNYGYLVIDEANQTMIAIDPADTDAILPVIKEEEENGHELLASLTTHKHWDHAGGNKALAQAYPGVTIAGPSSEEIPALTLGLDGTEDFRIGASQIRVLSTPCHTRGHVVFVVSGDPNTPPLLFSGDTLFVGGCGRFFEGTGSDMHDALSVILTLPLETRVYCGHEYTLSNLAFASSIEPLNAELAAKVRWTKDRRKRNLPTVPSTLEQELRYNPFLRVNETQIQRLVGGETPQEVLSRLRVLKDNF